MRYASCSTQTVSAYRAGVELGEGLKALAPEVVVLFFTIHYLPQAHELLGGLRDRLDGRCLVVGCSADGIYAGQDVANVGACALGINSQGRARFSAALEREVGRAPKAVAEKAGLRAQSGLAGPASTALVFADGVTTDGVRLVEGLRRAFTVPFFGALAADDHAFAHAAVSVNGEVAEDAVAVLAIGGPVPFRLGAASGWCPVGNTGHITACDETCIKTINNRKAVQFFSEQVGFGFGTTDLGTLPLAEFFGDDPDDFALRSVRHLDADAGAMELFGRIQCGARVQVCVASVADILMGVNAAIDSLRGNGFSPKAVMLISCAGRKWRLPESGREELERVRRLLGDIPLIGMPSFGEISPFRRPDGDYSTVQFHNVTLVVCALGA